SEERRVGKECRSGRPKYHEKKAIFSQTRASWSLSALSTLSPQPLVPVAPLKYKYCTSASLPTQLTHIPNATSSLRSVTRGIATLSSAPSKLRFFFSSRRRHTRFSRDWSSDVCSSD